MKVFIKKVIWFLKKNWMYSPWHVICFFIQEWEQEKLYLANLNAEEKQAIKVQKRHMSFAFFISVILHIGVFYLLVFNKIDSVLVGEVIVEKINTVDFKLTDGMVSADLDSVYNPDSLIVVDSTSLIQNKKINDLDELLKSLKGSNYLAPDIMFKDYKRKSKLGTSEQNLKRQIGNNNYKKIKRRIVPLKVKLWNDMKLLKSAQKPTNINYADIMKVIDKYSMPFRNCYEQALLQDEDLSVKVEFVLVLKNTRVKHTTLRLHGDGNPRSRRTLSHCLFKESKILRFFKIKKNISIKFNLIFGLK